MNNKSTAPSKICYGTLSLSPLQSDISLKEKIKLLLYAYENGINFFDTAELYDNYNIFIDLLNNIDRDKIYISTKSYAYSSETAEYSVNKALKETGADYLDIFMLHEQVDINTYNGHRKAIERLIRYKEQGIINKIGISTHYVAGVLDYTDIVEIDVIHPIFNYSGIGIIDGTIDDMIIALKKARKNDKYILAMKALAGGHLSNNPESAINFSLNSPYVNSTAIGMQYFEEIDFNVMLMKGIIPEVSFVNSLHKRKRTLLISDWCTGCGKCINICQHSALEIINSKCVVNMEKCVLCSYCAGKCIDFNIKII